MVLLKVCISCFLLVSLGSCASLPTFFEGEWHAVESNVVEVWEQSSKTKLTGYSYKKVEDRQDLLETLEIVQEGRSLIYRATVPTQNEGKTIPFVKTDRRGKMIVFENPDHDFPKKLIYELLDSDTMHVMVLGENDRGFEVYYSKAH